jgi:molybdenum-dependent DNA-binding transcriptional regulator ModE
VNCCHALSKIGISALQLAKEISVSYRIAWKLMHKSETSLVKDFLFTQLQGKIELDETYFGREEHHHCKYGEQDSLIR